MKPKEQQLIILNWIYNKSMKKGSFNTDEKLFEVVILSINENYNLPIDGACELLKETWFFLNSDEATFNGKEIEKEKRPLLVNPIIIGKPNFDNFFESVITYNSKQDNIELIEQDFINDLAQWIEIKKENSKFSTAQKRKFNEFLKYIKIKDFTNVNNKLSSLITNDKGDFIIEQIKVQFKNIKGKRLKLLLKAMQHLKLIPLERVTKQFYECCKSEFDWNIASYQALNDYTFNENTDKDEFNLMIDFFENIIKE